MKAEQITTAQIEAFRKEMKEKEKADATIEKYFREIELLSHFLRGRKITKELLIEYREKLQEKHKTRTVNVKLSAVNAFLDFTGWQELRMKFLRIQRNVFAEESRELTEAEYRRLLKAAKRQKNDRMYHVLLTLAGTGIRVSELGFITVAAVKKGRAEIRLKGKTRTVLLTKELRNRLLKYAACHRVKKGPVFCTKNNKPLDRSNLCHEMKKLCGDAAVEKDKVFPHNLRHQFARTFYAIEKNLAHLADILGHSSVETTRIYVAASAKEYERTLCRMRLII